MGTELNVFNLQGLKRKQKVTYTKWDLIISNVLHF